MTIQKSVNAFRQQTPNMRPRAIKLDARAEEALMSNYFRSDRTASKKARRSFIERAIMLEKPSGIEIIIWDQDVTEVCLAVPAHL